MVGVSETRPEKVSIEGKADDNFLSLRHVGKAELVTEPCEKENDVKTLHPAQQWFRQMRIFSIEPDIDCVDDQSDAFQLP